MKKRRKTVKIKPVVLIRMADVRMLGSVILATAFVTVLLMVLAMGIILDRWPAP